MGLARCCSLAVATCAVVFALLLAPAVSGQDDAPLSFTINTTHNQTLPWPPSDTTTTWGVRLRLDGMDGDEEDVMGVSVVFGNASRDLSWDPQQGAVSHDVFPFEVVNDVQPPQWFSFIVDQASNVSQTRVVGEATFYPSTVIRNDNGIVDVPELPQASWHYLPVVLSLDHARYVLQVNVADESESPLPDGVKALVQVPGIGLDPESDDMIHIEDEDTSRVWKSMIDALTLDHTSFVRHVALYNAGDDDAGALNVRVDAYSYAGLPVDGTLNDTLLRSDGWAYYHYDVDDAVDAVERKVVWAGLSYDLGNPRLHLSAGDHRQPLDSLPSATTSRYGLMLSEGNPSWSHMWGHLSCISYADDNDIFLGVQSVGTPKQKYSLQLDLRDAVGLTEEDAIGEPLGPMERLFFDINVTVVGDAPLAVVTVEQASPTLYAFLSMYDDETPRAVQFQRQSEEVSDLVAIIEVSEGDPDCPIVGMLWNRGDQEEDVSVRLEVHQAHSVATGTPYDFNGTKGDQHFAFVVAEDGDVLELSAEVGDVEVRLTEPSKYPSPANPGQVLKVEGSTRSASLDVAEFKFYNAIIRVTSDSAVGASLRIRSSTSPSSESSSSDSDDMDNDDGIPSLHTGDYVLMLMSVVCVFAVAVGVAGACVGWRHPGSASYQYELHEQL